MSGIRRWASEQRASGGYDRWVSRTDTALIVLALVFLGILVAPLIAPNLSHGARLALTAGSALIWFVFVIDYLTRLYLAERRGRFIRQNIPDLIVIAVPMLRPLRALRAVRLLRLLGLSGRVGVASRRTLHSRVAGYVSLLAVLALFVASSAMLLAERSHKDGNIKTFGDALWWAATTVTTVGYGDRYPVTTEGRAVAIVLMVVGIALLGVVTASVAAWFVGQLASTKAEVEESVSAETQAVLTAIEDLRQRLDRVERHFTAGDD